MKCTNCGAHLTDEDEFCPRCGTKVIRDRRCPDCGAILREGTNFCNKCGRRIAGEDAETKVTRQTLDIPIDVIERNILSETAVEIRMDHRDRHEAMPSSSRIRASDGVSVSGSSSSGRRKAYREEKGWGERDEGSWEKDEEAWDADEEEWDDVEEDDDEREGTDFITVMTAVMGCVILVVIAFLGFHFYRQYTLPGQETETEENVDVEGQQDAEAGGQGEAHEPEQGGGIETKMLTVIKNVNVRDKPSTSDSNVLKVAKIGETYECTGSTEDGEWYILLLPDGTAGYVFHEYVTVE